MTAPPRTIAEARARHRRFALCFTAIAIALAQPAAELALDVQAVLLGIGVLLTGVPHGAVDHLRAAPLLRGRLGTAWLPAFVIAYAGLALLVAGVWWLLPTLSLFGFLLLSVHHFGTGDAEDDLGVLTHGSLPIVLPAIAHPDQVAALFAPLTGSEASAWAAGLCAAQAPLAAATTGLLVAFLVARRRGDLADVVEVLAKAALFCLLPPLLSFAVYFCVWHAPRHILAVAQELSPGPWTRSLAAFGRSALPMSLATLVGAIAIGMLLPRELLPLQRWLPILFVGLAALTVPHLIVTDTLRRKATPTVGWPS